MQGASREALAALRERFRDDAEVATTAVGRELLAVAALVGREHSLRNALTDPGSSPQRRADLAAGLLAEQISSPALGVVSSAVGQRWSRPRDLIEALEVLGAESELASAERDGRIDAVEEELFRFARVLESSAELQIMLSDPAVSDQAKSAVVTDLLADRTQPETADLVTHAAAHPAGEPVAERLERLVRLAAHRRQQLLADVRAPVPLTEQQQDRLAQALSRIYGQQVTVAVSIDPELKGGAVVRIGDEIIDGSVASRLAAVRRTLTQ